jgi:hypothetical protein
MTNLPLATSTWPRVQQTIEHCLQGLPAKAREQVLWKNAASLYGVAISAEQSAVSSQRSAVSRQQPAVSSQQQSAASTQE